MAGNTHQPEENQSEETDDADDEIEPRLEREEEEEEEEESEARQPENQLGEFRDAYYIGNNFVYLDLLRENAREFRNFAVVGRESSFRLRPLPEGEEVYAWIENAIRELHSYAVLSSAPGDYIGLSFDSPNLSHGPAGISFRPSRDLTLENIWNLLSSLAQSSGGLNAAQEFDIRVFRVTPPVGRGRKTIDITHKRSILGHDREGYPNRIIYVFRAR